MAICDGCKEKFDRVFEVDGVENKQFCSTCQSDVESDLIESETMRLLAGWDDY